MADSYVDVASLRDPDSPRSFGGGISELSSQKLYRMLRELEEEGHDDIASFLPHGRAFMVRKNDKFVQNVVLRFFREQKKFGSFSR